MSTSYDNLRALSQRHEDSIPVTPLLPSPIARDARDGERKFFKFRNPRERLSISSDGPIDSLQILSYYFNDSDNTGGGENEYSSQEEDEDDDQTSSSDFMPSTPHDHDRGTFCSDESGWLANTTSHEERRRRFKARFYQVVQHPYPEMYRTHGDDEVLIATVLVGPGKPKLVQIQRPPSSQSRHESPVADLAVPSTPVLAAAEVSAFSPYDTPPEAPRIESCLAASEPIRHGDTPKSREDVVPPQCSSVFARSRSCRSDNSVSSNSLNQVQELADPFDTSPQRSMSYRSCQPTNLGWTVKDIPSQKHMYHWEHSPTTNVATWSRCRKMERALKAVTGAIDNFPDGMLRLDSPPVLEIRCPHVADEIYIQTLQKVFPAAPSLLISALTAWVIIDLYFCRLKEPRSATADLYWAQAAASNESLHRIPHKAREMLGIGLPDSTSIRLNEYVLRRRAAAVHASIEAVGQRLIEALRGSWDDDIWRSLKALVEIIEAGPRRWD